MYWFFNKYNISVTYCERQIKDNFNEYNIITLVSLCIDWFTNASESYCAKQIKLNLFNE